MGFDPYSVTPIQQVTHTPTTKATHVQEKQMPNVRSVLFEGWID